MKTQLGRWTRRSECTKCGNIVIIEVDRPFLTNAKILAAHGAKWLGQPRRVFCAGRHPQHPDSECGRMMSLVNFRNPSKICNG